MAHAWKDPTVAEAFLTDSRKRIPFGQEQIDIMIRIISAAVPKVNHILDLGCGDGILTHALLTQYPNAQCVLLDYSQPMLEAARRRFSNYPTVQVIETDLLASDWKNQLDPGSFDVAISGYAIHHLPHGRKYELYQEIYDVLAPNGAFVNIEHVASVSTWGERLADQMAVDTVYQYLLEKGTPESKDVLRERHENRLDKADNILLSVETQCDWLREIGFHDVDCYFKCFELAVFAGRKSGTLKS